ncbi:MAG: polynucleotide adenylyltransferase [Deltaproteobacteria bacterium]|nr:MAG: polynucleotide adenylyltransferase [Deltaproteobacteria bacterium]
MTAPTQPPPDLVRLVRQLQGRQALQVLAQLAADRHLEVYLVGGVVRELGRGRQAPDLDLAVNRHALELAAALADQLGGTFVLLDERERTARVVWQGENLDFAEFRAPDLVTDLHKRDFTINAMAISLIPLMRAGQLEWLDPWGGREDLEAGRVQILAAENFHDDPLRMLRAFRFAATHGLTLTADTWAAICKYRQEFRRVAGERIHQELFHLLGVERTFPTLVQMDQAGLLGQIFPELEDLKGVEQNGYHHLDVFQHSMLAVDCLEQILLHPQDWFGDLGRVITDYARRDSKAVLLKLAALFHDLGKPQTQERRDDPERFTFYHHERLGAELFTQIAWRLRFSQEELRTVVRLIELHMRPFLLLPIFRQGELTLRALGRLVKAARPVLPGLFALAMADSLAGQGLLKPADAEAWLADFCAAAYQFLTERLEPMEHRPRLISGDDLIQEFHLTPGPQFRQLLEAVEEACLEGRISTRQQALDLVKKLL